jgi:glyoxylase-like metal-dependent hydrolase (beta-lactamase superfamily II)
VKYSILASTLLCSVLFFGSAGTAMAQEAPTRSIVNIAPDLYRAQNNNHYTVFLVTSEGVIMSDPINRDFATWLKGEIESRHDQQVRYVLYSHHDWDHASGGAVFEDTAQFIGQANMHEELTLPAGDLPLPGNTGQMDANGNNRLERGEASGNTATRFDLTDANNDGVLSGAELIRGPANDVRPPDVTFADRHVVTLGGKTVEMVHLGDAHAPDISVLYFPRERVVFGVDVLQAKRLPQSLAPRVGAQIDAMKTIEALDFDIAATGHSMIGTKADVTALREYFEELVAGVAAGIAEGQSLEEMQQSLRFDRVREWERGETHPAIHIGQVYEMLLGSK